MSIRATQIQAYSSFLHVFMCWITKKNNNNTVFDGLVKEKYERIAWTLRGEERRHKKVLNEWLPFLSSLVAIYIVAVSGNCKRNFHFEFLI